MVTYTRKVVFGSAIVLLMQFFASIIAYLTRMILARNLTTTEYGLFYAVFTFILFLMFFRNIGMGQALVKYIPEFKIKKKYHEIKTGIVVVLGLQFLSSSLLVLVLFFLSDYLTVNYFKNPAAKIIILFLFAYVFLSFLFQIHKSIFQGFQKTTLFAFVEFLKNLIVMLLVLLFFQLGYRIFTPIFAYVFGALVLFLILLPFTLKTYNFFQHRVVNIKEVTKKITYFGFPVFLTSVGGKVIGYIDTLMLTYFVSLENVAVYNVVLPTAMLFLFIGRSISAVVFPMVSELWTKKDNKKISEGLKLMHKYSFLVIVPLALIIFFFAEQFLQTVFPATYVAGKLALQILIFGVLLYVVGSINNSMIAGMGKPKTITKIILFAALINVVANIFLIPSFGINGAAVATTLSYLIILILSTYKISQFVKVKFPWIIYVKIIVAGAFFLGTLYCLTEYLTLNLWVEMVLAIVLGTTIYLILAFILRIIDLAEIKKYWVLAWNKK